MMPRNRTIWSVPPAHAAPCHRQLAPSGPSWPPFTGRHRGRLRRDHWPCPPALAGPAGHRLTGTKATDTGMSLAPHRDSGRPAPRRWLSPSAPRINAQEHTGARSATRGTFRPAGPGTLGGPWAACSRGATRDRRAASLAPGARPGLGMHTTENDGRQISMKWWKWTATAAMAGVGLILFTGKDDIRRMRRMRQM
jgi:hypothetical protein